MNSDEQKMKHQMIVVSDVHLKDKYDERYSLLLHLLDSLDARHVKYLVLLGDIFDFCFGAGDYFKGKFYDLGQKLTDLSDRGIKVVFVQGNHEFSLKYLNWPGVDFVDKREKTINLDDKYSISFSHGDRLKAPWHYHLYSAISRSFLFRWGGLMIPQDFLDKLSLNISSKSRMHSEQKKINHSSILNAMQEWLIQIPSEQEIHHGIVGHFHCPYDVKRKDEKKGRLLCLKSWDQPNFLAFDQGCFVRYEYKKEALSFVALEKEKEKEKEKEN